MKINVLNFSYLSILIFVELYELRNAKKVSKKLNVNQPKISRELTFIREVMGDQLFKRGQYGMIPNHFADNLYPSMKRLLDNYKALENHIDNN